MASSMLRDLQRSHCTTAASDGGGAASEERSALLVRRKKQGKVYKQTYVKKSHVPSFTYFTGKTIPYLSQAEKRQIWHCRVTDNHINTEQEFAVK